MTIFNSYVKLPVISNDDWFMDLESVADFQTNPGILISDLWPDLEAMYCLYPAKMWANQDSRLSWCQTFLLKSDDHHAVPGRLATCGAIIPAMQHPDVQGGECSAVMNRPQEPTEVNTSFLRGDFVGVCWFLFFFCIYIYYVYIYIHIYISF